MYGELADEAEELRLATCRVLEGGMFGKAAPKGENVERVGLVLEIPAPGGLEVFAVEMGVKPRRPLCC